MAEKTEKMKEISNKRVQELSARDKKYKDAKNKIVNLEEVENCCNLIIEKNNEKVKISNKVAWIISSKMVKYIKSKLRIEKKKLWIKKKINECRSNINKRTRKEIWIDYPKEQRINK